MICTGRASDIHQKGPQKNRTVSGESRSRPQKPDAAERWVFSSKTVCCMLPQLLVHTNIGCLSGFLTGTFAPVLRALALYSTRKRYPPLDPFPPSF